MKISKAGIRMYEEGDELNGSSPIFRLADAINKLRVELNAMAEVIDRIMEGVGMNEPETSSESRE